MRRHRAWAIPHPPCRLKTNLDACSPGTTSAAVIHLEAPSPLLNATRIALGSMGLLFGLGLLVLSQSSGFGRAVTGDWDATAAHVGHDIWPWAAAGPGVLLAVAVVLRSPVVAFGGLFLWAALSAFLLPSIGIMPILAALILWPAVMDYNALEALHRRSEPVPPQA